MQLDLGFACGPDGRTGLTRRRVAYPWALTRPFQLDRAPAGMATAIPQSASGGLYAGERLAQRVSVAAGASAHVTTQGATVVHAGRDGRHAENAWCLDAGPGALLEQINDPLVLLPEADLRQRVTIDAAPDALVVYAESVGWHPAPLFRRFEAVIAIRRDGRIVALERTVMTAEDVRREQAAATAPIGGLGLLLVVASDPALTDRIAAALSAMAAEPLIGIGTLPDGAGLAVRIAAASLGAIPPLQQRQWSAVREAATGLAPPGRRRGA